MVRADEPRIYDCGHVCVVACNKGFTIDLYVTMDAAQAAEGDDSPGSGGNGEAPGGKQHQPPSQAPIGTSSSGENRLVTVASIDLRRLLPSDATAAVNKHGALKIYALLAHPHRSHFVLLGTNVGVVLLDVMMSAAARCYGRIRFLKVMEEGL